MPDSLDNILISCDQPNFEQKLAELRVKICAAAAFDPIGDEGIDVAKIIEDVGKNKDKAVAECTKIFDGVELTPEQFRISKEELEKAHKEVDKDLLALIQKSIKNVKKYQKKIFVGKNKKFFGGTGIKYTPIERVGICVPGASAPLPSTVIMTAVPAKVAGVKEIVVVSPPRYKGTIYPVILAVCCELKIDEVYRIGGAQAVATLAHGTETIRLVDKIVGPGNKWVQTAKRTVFGSVGIDSIAGPSEVLIIANDKAEPAYVAADMLSQAEHAPGSAILFTDSQKLAEEVLQQLQRQLKQLGRVQETIECLGKFSGIVVFRKMDDAIGAANLFASEHLEIQCGNQSRKIAEKIKNAGAIFIGDYSPVAIGDYWAGPSHTLPTGGCARFSSALTSNDFIKSTSIIEYGKKQFTAAADDIIRLAEIEGLDAHAKSVKIRQQDK